ncbi:TPA: hypothetical protein RSW58_003187, partial [Vibrio cholerae]|nr:hypothetical protein [Vibrio cholerae]
PMDDFLEKYIEAMAYFDRGLPYWCNHFFRPIDEEFARYLRSRGCNITYRIFEIFEQVYIPSTCDYHRVEKTANVRVELRNQGVPDELLPILL